MIKIIPGQPGEGKTKVMIEEANEKVKSLKGVAVYIDSSNHHRFALAHQIKLIEGSSLPLTSPSNFISFLLGIISSNHDIEIIFIDELFKLTHASIDEISRLIDDINVLASNYKVEFVIGTSCSKHELPQHLIHYLIA